MTPTNRNILMAAAAGASGSTVLEFIGLLVPRQISQRASRPSQEDLSLAILAVVFLFLLAILVYVSTGALLAYLSRRERLPLRRVSLLGGLAAALGALVPSCFFAAVRALASHLARDPASDIFGQPSSVEQPLSFVLMIAAAALWAVLLGGGFGAIGAAVTTNFLDKHAPRDGIAATAS